MNLYNMGFACGLLAMILVPVMSSMGANPTVAHHWAEGYNLHFAIFLGVLCLGLTVAGFFFSGRPAWAAWAGYRRLLRTTGRAPSDYLRMFGPAPVLINMGVNGLIGMAFILATGGDLNGPTLGGILTIMGFSAFGKHARNITPIMLGVVIGGVFMHFDINQSSVQLALLFGTTLAPISGYFGWPFGIVAGFLHSSVVLHAGTPVEGINLYNNGFSGGLLAIVLYPIISEAIRHHRPGLQDRDYFDDTIEHDEPLVPPLFCAEKARISPKRCRRTDINLKKCTFSNTLPLFYKLKYSIEKERYQSLYGKVVLTICCFEKVHNSKLEDGRQIYL